MRTKKVRNPARLFDPSENISVFVQTDTCQTCVRFEMCVNPSVILSVFYVGKSVDVCVDGHVSDMCVLRDVRTSISDSVGIVRR
jgi:hypothetical protein